MSVNDLQKVTSDLVGAILDRDLGLGLAMRNTLVDAKPYTSCAGQRLVVAAAFK